MPKRKNDDDKIKFYLQKIKKLESNRRRRRRVISSESSDSEEEQCGTMPESNLNITSANEVVDSTPETHTESNDVSPTDPQAEQFLDAQPGASSQENIEAASPAPAPGPSAASPAQPESTEPELDPLLLMALGESTTDSPEFGDKIHENLAQLWTPILKKGIQKDTKQKLLKDHLVPDNCRLLQAPKLNAEITAACAESVRNRDKKYLAIQQQLGQGIAAVNRGMHSLLKDENKVESLKFLSDSCRILSDLHYTFTKDRTKLISPSVDKKYLHVLQDTERDETLFGKSLSEKLKASSAIDKQGHQIKKTAIATRTTTMTTGTRSALPPQGNYPGPSRYPSNRGGRGGPRKSFQPPATRRPFNPPPAPQPRLPYQNRPRGPAQQQQ